MTGYSNLELQMNILQQKKSFTVKHVTMQVAFLQLLAFVLQYDNKCNGLLVIFVVSYIKFID